MDEDRLREWFGSFLDWLAAGRGGELLEAVSDCAHEQHLNATTAAHMRLWGRRHVSPQHFWARSEWEKKDLTWGVAPEKFEGWSRDEVTKPLGVVEAKLAYWHEPNGRHAERLNTLRSQLSVSGEKWPDRWLHGLLWLVSYEQEPEKCVRLDGDEGWASSLAGLTPLRPPSLPAQESPFYLVAERDLREVWPRSDAAPKATLYVSLLRYEGQQ